MDDWRTQELGELVVDGELSYGIVQPGEHIESGIPIVRVKDLRNGRVDRGEPLCVEPSISQRHARTVLRGGELLISIVGTIGETAVVPTDLAGWNVARAIAVIRPSGIKAEWLRVCLRSRAVMASMNAALNTTVQATLNLSELKRLSIPVPPVRVRDAITQVLGALDDKIAANEHIRRVADDLLAAVFDRLRAGSPHAELGDIGIVNRAVTKPVPGAQLRYIDISSVGQGSFGFPRLTSWDDAPGRARRVLSRGDTIWSTVRPNRRSHALILDDDPLLVASTGLAVLSPKPRRVAGLFEATKTDEFTSYLESVAEGSAYPAVRGDRFERAPVPDLLEDQWDSFEQLALPIRRRAHLAERESRRLVSMRDELLPLLMSGKVRVKDAEAAVSGVL
jgi:type I restriction enzyme, S subunit